ncbi:MULTISPECIES: hypothetical protein [Aerosakkonema]|uniref:hypothetical protein n=1 Tax=Aerosakkonema TaxID=1246629 RepID=UPI0035B9B62D
MCAKSFPYSLSVMGIFTRVLSATDVELDSIKQIIPFSVACVTIAPHLIGGGNKD